MGLESVIQTFCSRSESHRERCGNSKTPKQNRDVPAVPGVPTPITLPSLSRSDEAAIFNWLANIEETDSEIIAEVLDKCRRDPDALTYFLRRAEEVSDDDPNRLDRECGLLLCHECRSFRGYSQPCAKGYAPTPKTHWRRCEDFREE